MFPNKVSILIPVYNREEIISVAIESSLSQTYKNIEVIIVDNSSTDRTFEICKKYEENDSRVKVYKNEENIGPVRNWLECLKYSSGEYIKFLWSDDWMDKEFVEKTVEFLDNNTEIAFAYSSVYVISENNKVLLYDLFSNDTVYDYSIFSELSILGGNVPVSPGCAIFRKKDVTENLLIDIPNKDNLNFSKFGAGNDLLLFLLTFFNYKKVAYVNSTKSYFRAHKDSITCSNDLSLYYDWAKLYYINRNNDIQLKRKFKTKIYMKSLKYKKYRNINKEIDERICVHYIVTVFLKKIKGYLKLSI